MFKRKADYVNSIVRACARKLENEIIFLCSILSFYKHLCESSLWIFCLKSVSHCPHLQQWYCAITRYVTFLGSLQLPATLLFR